MGGCGEVCCVYEEVYAHAHAHVCVCVCVRERERMSDRKISTGTCHIRNIL